jgi:broad specificity phosphatase PhoE
MSKDVFFVRHGETDWNKLGLPQGSKNDIPLNSNGKTQSKKTGNYLDENQTKFGSFDLILSSPMKRAYETATIIADELNYHDKIIINKNLIEVDSGLISIGKKSDELKKDPFYDDFFEFIDQHTNIDIIEKNILTGIEMPDVFINKYKMESNKSCNKRAKKIIKYLKKKDFKRAIIVSHNETINNLNKKILNSLDTIKGNMTNGKNCHITHYKILNKKFQLICAPNTLHLGKK